MKKTVKGKAYDTDKMELVKKVTFKEYGDPQGYEEILFKAADGAMFLYANGGAESKYAKETLTAMTAAKADAWTKAN